MNLWRILHHPKNYLGKKNTIVLIIGYQVEGSLGRRFIDKEKCTYLWQEIQVQADVRSFSLRPRWLSSAPIHYWIVLTSSASCKISRHHGELKPGPLSSRKPLKSSWELLWVPWIWGDGIDLAPLRENSRVTGGVFTIPAILSFFSKLVVIPRYPLFFTISYKEEYLKNLFLTSD